MISTALVCTPSLDRHRCSLPGSLTSTTTYHAPQTGGFCPDTLSFIEENFPLTCLPPPEHPPTYLKVTFIFPKILCHG